MSAERPTGERGQRLTCLVKRLEMAERARMEEVLRPLGVTLHWQRWRLGSPALEELSAAVRRAAADGLRPTRH